MAWSVGVSLVSCIAGLLMGAVVEVPCSALIVMTMASIFIMAKLAQSLRRALAHR